VRFSANHIAVRSISTITFSSIYCSVVRQRPKTYFRIEAAKSLRAHVAMVTFQRNRTTATYWRAWSRRSIVIGRRHCDRKSCAIAPKWPVTKAKRHDSKRWRQRLLEMMTNVKLENVVTSSKYRSMAKWATVAFNLGVTTPEDGVPFLEGPRVDMLCTQRFALIEFQMGVVG